MNKTHPLSPFNIHAVPFIETEQDLHKPVSMQEGESLGLPWTLFQFDVEGEALFISVRQDASGRLSLCLNHQGQQPVHIGWGLQWDIAYSDDSYTLIPGIFYNGNHSERTHDIVRWGVSDQPIGFGFRTSAAPVFLHREAGGETLFLEGLPTHEREQPGWCMDRAKGTVALRFPSNETPPPGTLHDRYGAESFVKFKPGQILRLGVRESRETCATIEELTGLYFTRTWSGKVSDGEDVVERLRTTAPLVLEHLRRHHWAEDQKSRPIFLNAVFTAEKLKGQEPPEWAKMYGVYMGWNTGPGAAVPFLRCGGRDRDKAVQFLDLLAAEAVTPNGMVYPRYDEAGHWETAELGEASGFHHVRIPAVFAEFMMRAWREERSRGQDHPAWLQASVRVTDALCDLWRREKDFGFYVDYMAEEPVLLDRGSGAGAFALRALVRRLEWLEEDENRSEVLEVYSEATRYYYEHFLSRGHVTGGPLDIDKADDSESVNALGAAFTVGARVTGGDELLKYACAAAHLFSTWVLAWSAPFPSGSPLDGRDPLGGVLANTQNRHVGPGVCTDSAHWLSELSELTGDERYRNLYRQIVRGATEFVSLEDGDLWGGDGRQYPEQLPFYQGQITEQINVSDTLQDPGEAWNVSASWPAMSLLLMACDEGVI